MKKNNTFFILINFLYNVFMILYSLMPSYIIIVFSLLLYFYDISYFKNKKKYDIVNSIFNTSILFIPTSFVSILATDYGSLPLTWFSLSIIIMCIIIFLKKQISIKYLFCYILFLVFFVITIPFSNHFASAISQFFTITLFLLSFIIGEYIKKNGKYDMENIKNMFLLSTFAFAFQVLFQKIFIETTGNIIGHFSLMGGNRYAYAGLLGDYSFASLFLVTGAMLIFLIYIKEKRISFVKFIFGFGLLSITSVIISARTGIVSLLVIIILYFFFNFTKNTKKILLLSILGLLFVPILFKLMTSVRQSSELFSGSGRLYLIQKAFSILKDNLFFGIGFGIETINKEYSMIVPHNFFAQYLMQFGIIGFSLLFINFIIFYVDNHKNNYLIWMFYLCMFGAMLIPDIVSSRFLSIVVIITMLNRKEKDNENKYYRSNI